MVWFDGEMLGISFAKYGNSSVGVVWYCCFHLIQALSNYISCGLLFLY